MGIIFFVIGIMLYFLPTYIGRNKSNFNAILVLNLLVGWTFIGWVVALVWAISGKPYLNDTNPANAPNISDDLLKLTSLKEKGLLSDDEFNNAKSKLLK